MRHSIFAFLVMSLPAVVHCAEIVQTGTASLDGTSGAVTFSLKGTNLSIAGQGTNPSFPCDESGPTGLCKPGDLINSALTGASGEGGGLGGVVAVNGQIYNYSAYPGSTAGAGIEFRFNLAVPNYSGSLPGSLLLTGPATTEAAVQDPAILGGTLLDLQGTGTVSIYLDLVQFPPEYADLDGYQLRQMQFTFGEVPEPAAFCEITLAAALLLSIRLLSRRNFIRSGERK
jgi:hypothetical protein